MTVRSLTEREEIPQGLLRSRCESGPAVWYNPLVFRLYLSISIFALTTSVLAADPEAKLPLTDDDRSSVAAQAEPDGPLGTDAAFSTDQIAFFERHIRPLLVEHCFDCHSTDAKQLKASLYVDSREGILQGGDSGPAIVPGQPNDSELIAAVRYESVEMPPKQKLSTREIELLEHWVAMGAPWPHVTTTSERTTGQPSEIDWEAERASHWAWRAYDKPDVPTVSTNANSSIDCFVDARLTAAGLRRSSPAPPKLLARRIYLDLIGIPPTPEQLAYFTRMAKRDHQAAVHELVDQLLQSPLYGQRWARHWLDVARYSEGRGGFLDNAALDQAYRYRDWVVHALNEDLPVDRFLELQIAGDLLGDYHDAVATGFFAVGPTYRSDGGDPDSVAQAKGETLDDRVDTLTRGLLGITGSCARCHDHKFDPIPQLDYYSLAGIFNNSSVHNLPLASAEVVERFQNHRKQVDDLKKKQQTLDRTLKKEARDATADETAQKQAWQKALAELSKNAPPGYETAHALRDSGDADMHLAVRGNLRREGEQAPRRFLRILAGEQPGPFRIGSGRRELAAAIVDPANPLTARVFVNRVWMHHFGNGLVRTPSNFGTLGEPPTHPALLDWLATDFVEHGWSLKRLHRQIIFSETYQQSSQFDERGHQLDGDHRLLWRMPPRRMDVESWRDSLLSVTGELDTKLGGRSEGDIAKSTRRTLYAKVSRNGDVFGSDEFLRRFDFPLMRATVAQRPNSIVPQQFLFLLNSQFMADRAKAFVRSLQATSNDDTQRIHHAYRILYGRQPDAVELAIGLQFVRNLSSSDSGLSAWEQYAQALLSSNEFMYVR